MKTNHETLKAIRLDMEKALNEIAKKHKLENIKIGTMRYDTSGFSTTINAQFLGVEPQEIKTLRENAKYIGLNEDIVNATINYSGKEFKVVGMKKTRLILEANGKEYLAPTALVIESLKKQNSPFIKQQMKLS